MAQQAGADHIAGSSLKAALECDRDDPAERTLALTKVLGTLEAVEEYPQSEGFSFGCAEVAAPHIETAKRVREQDVEEAEDGSFALRRGVARERLVSVEDHEMRHGRKSRRVRLDGYKRHVLLKDLDKGLVRAVGLKPGPQRPAGERYRRHSRGSRPPA